MLAVSAISLAYEKPVLCDVSLSLVGSEIIGLVGKSGAGKSSLLKIMAGLIDQDNGDVLLDGKLQPKSSLRLIPGTKGIELVNQDFKLDVYHTVAENIRESILYLPNAERERRVEQMLSLFELKPIRHQKAHLLSGGEQQRLAISRAVAKKPKVLLLDEPFAHLDARLRLKLTNFLLKLKEKEGVAMVIVSHDGQEILGVSDSICILKNGRLSRKKNRIESYYNPSSKIDALFFGPINSIVLNGKRVLFRPDEYKQNSSGAISLSFVRAVFLGSIYYNYFYTLAKEELVLISINPLNNTTAIDIDKKN
jgi:iron(III) transport system ATP-binding protein